MLLKQGNKPPFGGKGTAAPTTRPADRAFRVRECRRNSAPFSSMTSWRLLYSLETEAGRTFEIDKRHCMVISATSPSLNKVSETTVRFPSSLHSLTDENRTDFFLVLKGFSVYFR
ncbi:hypothetical protein ACFFRR_001145 [Megaselia abdita]